MHRLEPEFAHRLPHQFRRDLLARALQHRIKETINDIYAAQEPPTNTPALGARAKIAECETKLSRHRAALEAGADPVTITKRIAETNTQKAAAEAELRRAQVPRHHVLTPEQIEKLINALGGLVSALGTASPEERQEVYRRLGIRLTYHPGKHEIRVEANLDPDRIIATP